MLRRCCQSSIRCHAQPPRASRGRCHRGISSDVSPLRVLFCGSDDFSANILHRIHEEHSRNKSFISSIDVVTRERKPTGRGLKTFAQGPCQTTAIDLGLPVHEIPTFTGWSPPAVDLVLAVSFGLLVPPRILKSATHGGLNLHPSMLPDLWGPAPLHHTLLQGRTSSGVTLQTLHSKHFDRGKIVSSAAFDLPREGRITMHKLRDMAAALGGDLLIDSLRAGLHLPHHLDKIEPPSLDPQSLSFTHARKLTKEDAHVDWRTWSAEQILRTSSAVGSLWSLGSVYRKGNHATQRIRWSSIDLCTSINLELKKQMQVGRIYGVPATDSKRRVSVVKTADDRVLTIDSILPEGCSPDIELSVAARMIGREEL